MIFGDTDVVRCSFQSCLGRVSFPLAIQNPLTYLLTCLHIGLGESGTSSGCPTGRRLKYRGGQPLWTRDNFPSHGRLGIKVELKSILPRFVEVPSGKIIGLERTLWCKDGVENIKSILVK